jgi:orotate phosphoribosyltransferase
MSTAALAPNRVALDRIDVGENVRDLDPAHVDALACSIALRDLITPLVVRPQGAYLRTLKTDVKKRLDQRVGAAAVTGARLPVMRSDFARRIYERSHLTGEFQLRSGAVSDEYFDKYLFESDPPLLREIAGALLALLPDEVDALAGLELGGVPLATVVSQLSGLPTLFVRKHAKTYGTCRLAEGGEIEGQRLVVIEDVITSGGQVVESCRALRERGAQITTVLCVIDREAGGVENLASESLQLRSLFTSAQLETALSSGALCAPGSSLVELVEAARALPYGRPSDRTVEGMLREHRGTCSTKHLFLAEILAERFPETEPLIVHRVYRLDRGHARELFGAEVAESVPADGLVDVHRYLTITVEGQRITLDATFPGAPWDGQSSLPLACGPGRDYPAGQDPDAEKHALEQEHCDPATREPFIAALTSI